MNSEKQLIPSSHKKKNASNYANQKNTGEASKYYNVFRHQLALKKKINVRVLEKHGAKKEKVFCHNNCAMNLKTAVCSVMK